MRKIIKSILLEVGVGDLKIRSRGDNRCESAKTPRNAHKRSQLYGWDPVRLCAYDPAQSHVEYFLDCVLYMDQEL